jgi:tRNA (cmo5U34)-methyltransferase
MNKAGDDIKAQNANWKFSGDMVESFDTHVKKSVPLYDEGHTLISNLSDYFIKDDSICYELGSSTGVLLEKLANRHSFRDARFIGIELEEDMVKKADKRSTKNLSFICDDIKTYELEKSDMIIAYYTMQFIHPKHRQLLFDKIYDSLNWGGAFVLYEKVRANDARFQDILTGLYTEFKLDNGYSADEILAKSQSLKGVLEPFSTKGNLDLLKRAGFVDIITIQKFMNFEGFLAIK